MRYYAPFPGGGGDPARPQGPHALRIGDAERDAAATDLGEHYAAGRLTLDELHERLDAAFSAKTLGQLTRVMADLPGPRPWPGPGRLPWPDGPGALAGPGSRPTPVMPDMWGPPGPAGLHYHAHLGPADGHWHVQGHGPGGRQSTDPEEPTPTDRAGRFAALSLLMLAMLIWLFTALLFARHGVYHPAPMVPDHFQQYQGFGQLGP